jgi:hypothetical protein
MFPFVAKAFAADIEYGIYAFNENPRILSRVSREMGFRMRITGKFKAGKSFPTKLQFVFR